MRRGLSCGGGLSEGRVSGRVTLGIHAIPVLLESRLMLAAVNAVSRYAVVGRLL